MKHKLTLILCLGIILSGVAFNKDATSNDTYIEKPVVIIDPGHTKKMPGAISVIGRFEVAYNDNVASLLSKALNRSGFETIITRKPEQDITLEDRAKIANSHQALAMISIHHDSAQPVYLEPVNINGKKAYRTLKPISGYSIFISQKNPEFDRSFILAKLLGENLLKLGRNPTLHHAEPIPGEGRILIDAELGIYQYDDLVVLKQTKLPAVLLELGVIVDPSDETYVATPDNQKSMVDAIVNTLKEFDKR
jgi:N-acetylmuramoyl-L-alanine amidase